MKSKENTVQDITATIRRVRHSTRHGRKGLLLVCTDSDGKEYRLWYSMYVDNKREHDDDN